eukprot:291435_1
MSEQLSVIKRIDYGLESYYNSFPNTTYKNTDNIGKFEEFCKEQFDEKEIENQMKNGVKECTLISFDEDDNDINRFPLYDLYPSVENEQKRNEQIYKIMKHCYIHGIPPIKVIKRSEFIINCLKKRWNIIKIITCIIFNDINIGNCIYDIFKQNNWVDT